MTEPVRPLEVLVAAMRAIAADNRTSPEVPCQCNRSWHADTYDSWADVIEAALLQSAAPPAPTAEPTLKMADVRVGMRLKDESGYHMTVTGLTAKGFNYLLDEPRSLGARYGYYSTGEHYGHQGDCLYELIPNAAPPERVSEGKE